MTKFHCVKSVRIRSYASLYFSAFGLNTEIYFAALRIQFECGEIRTRITPNTDTFYAVSFKGLFIVTRKGKTLWTFWGELFFISSSVN